MQRSSLGISTLRWILRMYLGSAHCAGYYGCVSEEERCAGYCERIRDYIIALVTANDMREEIGYWGLLGAHLFLFRIHAFIYRVHRIHAFIYRVPAFMHSFTAFPHSRIHLQRSRIYAYIYCFTAFMHMVSWALGLGSLSKLIGCLCVV